MRTLRTLDKQSNQTSFITQKFEETFGGSPAFIASAPGRVNLIGEHTDYNDGYVFPVAIDKYINIAARKRPDRRVTLHALDVDDAWEFSLDTLPAIPPQAPTWSRYFIGVASLLEASGREIVGIDAVITGDVPIGAGLSSSAALSVAATLAFLTASSELVGDGFPVPEDNKKKLAALCQRVEHEFVDVKCGIMDQTISLLGKENHALFLDCRSLEYEHVPLNLGEYAIAICNTKVKRELAASEYNKRRAECERGVDILSRRIPCISSLRDIALTDFKKHEEELPALTQKRCRYVIEENARVLEAVSVLKGRSQSAPEETDASLIRLGSLMNASHNGLRDDYEVSCKELDLLTDIARSITGVIGSRMTGAGFGGCTVSVVHQDALEIFQTRITTEYHQQTGIEPEIYLCNVSDGAQVFRSPGLS
ncbi:galactokinase [Candidatus Poribacteria bacterium]|nr:galactokinase [Candidatus Poribacteria bacterium]MYK93847.1 galactokinase [Candidatus Poribacteria bacterium]